MLLKYPRLRWALGDISGWHPNYNDSNSRCYMKWYYSREFCAIPLRNSNFGFHSIGLERSTWNLWNGNGSFESGAQTMFMLPRAVLIPPYDCDSSRISLGSSRARFHSEPWWSSVEDRLEAKLFGRRERKISGILPEAVNLARKSILLTLIGPVTERRRIARMLSAYLIFSRSE